MPTLNDEKDCGLYYEPRIDPLWFISLCSTQQTSSDAVGAQSGSIVSQTKINDSSGSTIDSLAYERQVCETRVHSSTARFCPSRVESVGR